MSDFLSARFAVSSAEGAAFYIVHLLFRELLCSKIFHRFHNCSFWSILILFGLVGLGLLLFDSIP